MQTLAVTYPSAARAPDLEEPIVWLCGGIILLTFTLSAPLLNLFMPYSVTGGNFFAKFHPASWLAPFLLLLVWQDYAAGWRVPIGHLAWGIGLLGALIGLLAVRGKGALAATFIDIYLVPGILMLALSRLPTARVRTLLRLFIAIVAFNVMIVMLEFAARRALLPREAYERFFRPAGMFAHPIMAGTLFYCAMFLTSRGVVTTWLARPLMLLFLLGAALCRVRGPLAMAVLILVAQIIHPAVGRRHMSEYVLDLGLVLLLPFVILAVFFSGAFDRVLELGLWEQSAQSRFSIFDTIHVLNHRQFWNGVGGYDVGEFLATQLTGGQLIEDAFVSFVLQAGFPVAVAMTIILFILHIRAMSRSLIFVAMMVLIGTTTLGFGAKNMIPAAIALSGYWIQRRSAEQRGRIARAASTGAVPNAMA
jgi:hypothetical protein